MRNYLRSNIYIFFVLLSLFAGFGFCCFFGLLVGFDHPFLKRFFLQLFLLGHVVTTLIVYSLTFGEDIKAGNNGTFSKSRECVIVFLLAPIVSMIFPALSLLGSYPASMAAFHLMIIFYAGISFAAMVFTFYVSIEIWQSDAKVSGVTKYALSLGTPVLLGISCVSLIIIRMLTL